MLNQISECALNLLKSFCYHFIFKKLNMIETKMKQKFEIKQKIF